VGAADRDDSRLWRRDARECGGQVRGWRGDARWRRVGGGRHRGGQVEPCRAGAGTARSQDATEDDLAARRLDARLQDITARLAGSNGCPARSECTRPTGWRLSRGLRRPRARRRVRLVVRGHVASSRFRAPSRLCPSGCLMDARCIGRLTLEPEVKLPLLDLEHGCEPSRCIHRSGQINDAA
jgi:hypothetical protein